jgi:hypothetical protein
MIREGWLGAAGATGGATWLGAGTFCCAYNDDGNSAARAVNTTTATLGKHATDIECISPATDLINGYREKDKSIGDTTRFFRTLLIEPITVILSFNWPSHIEIHTRLETVALDACSIFFTRGKRRHVKTFSDCTLLAALGRRSRQRAIEKSADDDGNL